jgi:cation diffusion facilitator CzcD-associated flavoprotein CzcO
VSHHVTVIGAGTAGRRVAAELQAAGVTDYTILDKPGHEVVASVFDDATDSWALRMVTGETFRSDVVIAADGPVGEPWIPELAGRNKFRGVSLHAARWDPGFDPAGLRVAVIGADATAGHYIGRLIEPAASVTVFSLPPRRVVRKMPPLTKRWLRGRTRPVTDEPSGAALVTSPVDALTPSGVRTRDGVDHPADAVIFGTGFATPDATLVGARGLTIQRAWQDGMAPFQGVAVHGFPNYFFITGPDIASQAGYIADCVQAMSRTGSTRIEVRRSSQQVFNERVYTGPAQSHPVMSAFDLSAIAADLDATYDGAATLTIAGTGHPVRVRLSGRLDPIDGHYHWQGTVFGSDDGPLPDAAVKQARAATLTVGERSAPARIVEKTPWGTHAVAGVGAPPFAALAETPNGS